MANRKLEELRKNLESMRKLPHDIQKRYGTSIQKMKDDIRKLRKEQE